MTKTIAIVEDELKIAELLQAYLQKEHYETVLLHNGTEALEWLQNNTPELILLDLMLPEIDGLTICRELRKTSQVPIIMVTARVEEIDRLLGLEIGADDYICKPFSPREVVARVKTVLRRTQQRATPQPLPFQLDPTTATLSINGARESLTAVELNLLQVLSEKPGHIFSRDQLIDRIYTDHRVVSDRTVDSHIKKLRQKLHRLSPDAEMIISVYGMGYKFEV